MFVQATTTMKESEINGLKEITRRELNKMLDNAADRAINDLQAKIDVFRDRLIDHKRKNTKEHSNMRKEAETLHDKHNGYLDKFGPGMSVTTVPW